MSGCARHGMRRRRGSGRCLMMRLGSRCAGRRRKIRRQVEPRTASWLARGCAIQPRQPSLAHPVDPLPGDCHRPGGGPVQDRDQVQQRRLAASRRPHHRHGFTSEEIVRSADGTFTISVGPQARAGNWLPTGGIERFVLVWRLYDTPIGVATRTTKEGPMPAIARRGCA